MAELDEEVDIAPATSDEGYDTLAIPTEITVTVRRDFPLREGEKLGDWQWSSLNANSSGSIVNRERDPLCWQYDGDDEESVGPGEQLVADPHYNIIGWSIGSPSLGLSGGNPSCNGGAHTTDNRNPISAEVQLLELSEEGEANVVANGSTSGRHGEVVLNTRALSGEFIIRVIPEDRDDDFQSWPELADADDAPDIIYRTFEVRLRLQSGYIIEVTDPYDPPANKTDGRVGSRRLWEPTTSHLPLSLKPVWWKRPLQSARSIDVFDIDIFGIHCTGGSRMGNAIIGFLNSQNSSSVHYILDVDGHLIKLVRERNRASHFASAVDKWQRFAYPSRNNNDYSIGLEIINPSAMQLQSYMTRTLPPYQAEQYRTVIDLATDLVSAFSSIRHHIVGHNDVSVGPRKAGSPPVTIPSDSWVGNTHLHRRKPWDPGKRFHWELLENRSLGMVPQEHFNQTTHYDGVFHTNPDLVLSLGPANPAYSNAIRELKQDIADIGYSIPSAQINGTFCRWLRGAVDRFKRHFFSGSRWSSDIEGAVQDGVYGDINRVVATRIKNVAEEVRRNEQDWQCWLVRFSLATDLKFHTDPNHHHSYERGLIAVYGSRDDAESDGREQGVDAVGNPWQKANGTWERWIVLNTTAKDKSLYTRPDGRKGIIGIYYSRGNAEAELTAENPWQ